MKFQTFAALAFALGAFASPAAQAASVTRRPEVAYGDLNLASPAARHTLRLRIRTAARDVCAPEPQRGAIRARQDYDACLKASIEQASAAVPLLQADAGR